MKLKKIASILATTAVVSFAASNVAHAGAYSYANVHISNLDIGFSTQGTVGTVSFDSSANAITDGFPGEVTAESSFGVGPAFLGLENPNADQATSGAVGSIYKIQAADKFTPISTSGGMATFSGADGSRADSIVRTSTLVDGPAALTDVETVAEAERETSGGGNANGNVGSTTSFEFDLTITDELILTFDFDAEAALKSILHDDATGFARSDYDVSFAIKDATGADVFTWTPNGVLNDGIFGGTETADDCNLNNDIAATSLDREANASCTGNFTATTFAIGPGTYTLALSQHSGVVLNARKDVPEPATLALMGIGMLGMGFKARKKRAS